MSATGREARIVRGWQRFWGGSSSAQRLRDQVPAFRRDLEGLVETGKASRGAKPRWGAQAEALLLQMEEALARNNPEEGWRLFHAAQRVELQGLRETDPAGFRARAQSIYSEATSKLRAWRLKQVTALFAALPKPEASVPPEPRPVTGDEFAAAVESALLLHEHFSNEAFKDRAKVYQTRLIVGLGLGAALLWLAVYGSCAFGSPTSGGLTLTGALLHSALLFGLMGASFSALTSLAGQGAAQTIPEQLLTYRITLARQAVGVLPRWLCVFSSPRVSCRLATTRSRRRWCSLPLSPPGSRNDSSSAHSNGSPAPRRRSRRRTDSQVRGFLVQQPLGSDLSEGAMTSGRRGVAPYWQGSGPIWH